MHKFPYYRKNYQTCHNKDRNDVSAFRNRTDNKVTMIGRVSIRLYYCIQTIEVSLLNAKAPA